MKAGKTAEEAKRYLPPFLNDSEKNQIIQILVGKDDEQKQVAEAHLRALIRGMIRG